jgi:hypothetical protein
LIAPRISIGWTGPQGAFPACFDADEVFGDRQRPGANGRRCTEPQIPNPQHPQTRLLGSLRKRLAPIQPVAGNVVRIEPVFAYTAPQLRKGRSRTKKGRQWVRCGVTWKGDAGLPDYFVNARRPCDGSCAHAGSRANDP